MNIVIVERDVQVSQQLEQDLNGIGIKVINSISTFSEAHAAINREIPDCVICASSFDEKFSGLVLASQLSHLRLPFIFLDANPSLENYQKASNYPLGLYVAEPYNLLTLKAAIEEVTNVNYAYYASHIVKGKYIFLKRNNIFEKVSIHDITRLRSEGNYTLIYANDKKYIIKFSLTKLLELPHFNAFFRVHRNFAVQRDNILCVDFSNRYLETPETKVPFGRTYAKQIRKVMNLPYNLKVE